MKIQIKKIVDVEVKYLKAVCRVRYWEDASVNGDPEDDENPKIPFANGEDWAVIIELEGGAILDWPKGVTADLHYKVCDEGRYDLLDENKSPVVGYAGYVPAMMSPGGNGYGDYVIMSINSDGVISDWIADVDDIVERAS